jgi:4-hydroxythreonine-4-phosphate dehydrogenase
VRALSAPLALTMGDPAGIGPEIALAAWRALRGSGPAFFIIADAQLMRARAREAGIDVPVAAIADPAAAAQAFPRALPVLPVGPDVRAEPGAPSPAHAAAVTGSIEAAVALVAEGRAGAVVTNPIAATPSFSASWPRGTGAGPTRR